jgi:HAD superfamily hydrolase (TIGR01509 family)
MTISAILFDIDGTLVDSNYLHIEAWSQSFDTLDLAVDSWKVHRGIGMDSEKLLDALLGEDSPQRDEAKSRHDENYQRLVDRLRPFDQVRELLADLSGRGLTVILATSAPENELKHLREVLEVEDSIEVVTSAEDVDTAKPAPDVVNVALERAGVDAGDAVMIGDSTWDMKAAAAAGVTSIGVLSGGVSERELLDAGAVAVFEDAADLRAHIDDVVSVRD